MAHTNRTYKSWEAMKQRCLNPKNTNFKYYGAKGIGICEKWLEYVGFLADMGRRPPDTSLGRINNVRGYYKENCRWESRKEQGRNKGLYKNNLLGIAGVRWEAERDRWAVKGDSKYLWKGKDFFEACCRRKAWERDMGRN